MIRLALIALALTWCLTSIFIFSRPQAFHDVVPGLAMMGPFSVHFIRDVGLAFLASGLLLGWGSYSDARSTAYAAILWPMLHAAFHLQIWAHRGFPLDGIFAFDVVAVIAPPVLAMLGARQLGVNQAREHIV